ncbi:hypothetical protein DNTS_030226 [Danionella cerebrum]|uniref:C2H2-type domain-containing protein n=1 Tax=Danionella cerebrum TaxID=2873325 RepID=A0A553Q8C2_9TELE|nr:hypothetical protein DNTS_030226 [Danionella translucida]
MDRLFERGGMGGVGEEREIQVKRGREEVSVRVCVCVSLPVISFSSAENPHQKHQQAWSRSSQLCHSYKHTEHERVCTRPSSSRRRQKLNRCTIWDGDTGVFLASSLPSLLGYNLKSWSSGQHLRLSTVRLQEPCVLWVYGLFNCVGSTGTLVFSLGLCGSGSLKELKATPGSTGLSFSRNMIPEGMKFGLSSAPGITLERIELSRERERERSADPPAEVHTCVNEKSPVKPRSLCERRVRHHSRPTIAGGRISHPQRNHPEVKRGVQGIRHEGVSELNPSHQEHVSSPDEHWLFCESALQTPAALLMAHPYDSWLRSVQPQDELSMSGWWDVQSGGMSGWGAELQGAGSSIGVGAVFGAGQAEPQMSFPPPFPSEGFKLEPLPQDLHQPSPAAPPEAPSARPKPPPRRPPRPASCRCPNCLNAEALGETHRLLHNCHVPGCGKAYAKTSHLKAHLRWHSGARPFVCNWLFCGRRFARSEELQRHLQSHQGTSGRGLGCPSCPRLFLRPEHLSKHVRSHHMPAAAEATLPEPPKVKTEERNEADAKNG